MNDRYCDACGEKAREAARFCGACGRPLGPEEIPTAAGADPVEIPGVSDEVRQALRPSLRVERSLGRGGMGEVVLAKDVRLDRLVAVKVLPAAMADDREATERFLREARTAANLRHPHIVAIHDVGKRGRVTYFTMDYVHGMTLSQLVERQGPPELAEACRILADVADALAHAHRKGVVHRDVKPPNVMVQSDGHVFVMDFGLARREDGAVLTQSGVVHGTPEYISPEQAEGANATPASDAYAFGLTLFHLVAGRHLVRGETLAAKFAQHVSGDMASLATRDPRVPARLHGLLRALLAREPERRLSDLASAARSLREMATSGDGGTARAPRPQPAAPAGEAAPSSPALPSRPRTPSTPGRAKTRERLKGLLDKLDKAREDDET